MARKKSELTGRPRTFVDPGKRSELLTGLRAGLPAERACDYAQVSPRTYYRLMVTHDARMQAAEKQSLAAYGTEEYWQEFVPEKEKEEAIFCQEVKKTIAEFFLVHTVIIRKGKQNWQASAWMLERRDNKHFGRRFQWAPPGADSEGDQDVVPAVVVYLPDNGRSQPAKAPECTPSEPNKVH